MRKQLFSIVAFVAFAFLYMASNKAVAQGDRPFPYGIHIETVRGNCYDDCFAIITLIDDAGNEIAINPNTHNAVDTVHYPLYNIQYHYRNQSTGSNTRYDTLNTIQLTAGTYCLGVTAYVPVFTGTDYDYLLVDTTICNIPVLANYDHLEASVLSGIARYTWESGCGREFCGLHPDFECGDRGRIQLLMTKGKFPYHVLILDQNQDTVRQATYWQRENTGADSLYADYKDYYTFNNMSAGDYSIMVSDSCGYTIWMTVNVPLSFPYDPQIDISSSTIYHCQDTNVVLFPIYFNWNRQIYDYEFSYVDSMFEARSINPNGDTTAWHRFSGEEVYNYWGYYYDTIPYINNYGQLMNDTVYVQVHNICRDTIYSNWFVPHQDSLYFEHFVTDAVVEDGAVNDTCAVHHINARQTQSYNYKYIGDNAWESYWGGGDLLSMWYTCPLYFEIWSADDSTMFYQSQSDDFWGLFASFSMFLDTTINTHIVIHDAQGYVLQHWYRPFTFTVNELHDTGYPYYTDNYFYECCCRYLRLGETSVNCQQFRNNISVRLIDSPVYDKYNFNFTYDGESWNYELVDTTLENYYLDFSASTDGWWLQLNSERLPPGHYTFVCTTACGVDTVEFENSGLYYDELVWDTYTQFSTEQICDRLYVTPYGASASCNLYYIDPTLDNDEPILQQEPAWSVFYNVVDGVAGGWNNQMDDQGRFVFTIPGTYVIETYAYHQCPWINRYDTISYEPAYISFDMAYAVLCDAMSSTGNVLSNAVYGTAPYEYYLYDDADLMGNVVGSSSTGVFNNVPMYEGQQFSILVVDSCRNSFSINVVATSLSQSTLAWELGDNITLGHCEGDSAFFCALPFTHSVSYHWTGPNGFSSNDRQNSIYLPYGSESGWYVVELTNTGCGTSVFDSVYIRVIQAPTVTVLSDTTICPGDNFNVGFAVTGTGMVNYDVTHIGAPEQNIEHYTTMAGDTLWQPFDIWSDNTFWPGNIHDERCVYENIVDSVNINIFSATAAVDSSLLSTVDGYACLNQDAVVSVNSNLMLPYYVFWYTSPMQDSILQCDTITSASAWAQYAIPVLTNDTTFYVAASDNNHCASSFGAIYHWVNMQNGSLMLQGGESARFYDSGGELYDYSENEHFTYTFNCINRDVFTLLFNSLNINIGDTLFIYSGPNAVTGSLLAAITNSDYPPALTVHGNSITFVFTSNWANNNSGWSIDVVTDVAMAEVSAHIIPPFYDTVNVVLCQADTTFSYPGFPDLNISQVGDYTMDSMLVSILGCDSLVHLRVLVNPVSDTTLYDTLMHCQLPYVWNGVTFYDFGVQNTTFSNSYGCDSLITMNLAWAPGLEVYLDTTVCENDLPLIWHGETFTETDTVVIGLDTLIHLQVQVLNQHLDISSGGTIRTGDTIPLWVSGADLYNWAPSNSLSSSSGNSVLAFPERTTTYYINGYYAGIPSCPADTFVTVTVIPRNAVDDYVFTYINHPVDVFPLDNDTISCSNILPVIVGAPTHGTYLQNGTAVHYMPNTGYVGVDTLRYTITCQDTVSTAWIYVFVAPLSDNVDDAACTFTPSGSVWGIHQVSATQSPNSIVVSVPMIGDVDGDGQQEIVIPSGTSGSTSSSINIFDAHCQLETNFTIAPTYIWGSVGIAKVKFSPAQDENIIVVFGVDRYLYAYNANGSQLWRSDVPFTSHCNENIQLPSISFADFNHDGWSEIYVGGEIFDAATGKFLCKVDGNKGVAKRTWDASGFTYQTIASDLFGDFDLDLAIGNAVYDVNIQSRTNPVYNEVSLSRRIPDSRMVMEDGSLIPDSDGNTFVVDMNRDGSSDVVVMSLDQNSSTINLYVWDVRTESVICSKKIGNAMKFGTPQIGDLDGDGYPEICFIVGTYADHGTGSNDLIYALKYNPLSTNGAMDVFWTTSHNDNSGATGITMFDFNHDGLTELVYRDVSNLRVINGSLIDHITGQPVAQPYNLANIPCSSATGVEYPVVVDVDQDGEAEIVVGGNTFSTDFGYIYVYKSSSAPWAPAREVWNQYMYNVTNVNSDLSVPAWPFSNAAVFVDPQGAEHRPYNNFLQQGTSIDVYGRPFYAVPDAYISGVATVQYQPDSILVNFTYCNQGSNDLNAPHYVSLYQDHYPGTLLLVDTVYSAVPVGGCESYQVMIPKTIVCAHPDISNLTFVVNNAGFGIAQNGSLQGECDTTNNAVSVMVEVDVDSTVIFDTIVENQLPYQINGLVFTEAGTQVSILSNHNGCDSVVTVNLYVLLNVTSTLDSAICENQLPFTWNGQTFTEAGTATAVILAQSGADSTITMNVVVNPVSLTVFEDTICQRDGYFEHDFNISAAETDMYGLHTFYLNLTNQYDCDSVVELHLLISPFVEPDFIPDPDRAMLSEDIVFQFNNTTDMDILQNFNCLWIWDYGDDNIDSTNITNGQHRYDQWGEYTVTLFLNVNQCETSVSHQVFVESDLEFPNVITPNGDGSNDVFVIKNLNVNRPNRLQIFDRLGKKVYDQANYQTYMKDGTVYNADSGFNAEGLSEGVYYFRFHYDGFVKTVDYNSSLTVIR